MKTCIHVLVVLLFVASFSNAQIKTDSSKCGCCSVEIDASFPGGEKAWKNYLEQNFKHDEVRCQMPFHDTIYKQTAIMLIKISKDGSIEEIYCQNMKSISVALQNEAYRVIKNSPKWIPAQRNGRLVNAFRKEQISITISPLYL